jgi:hypothetical protein
VDFHCISVDDTCWIIPITPTQDPLMSSREGLNQNEVDQLISQSFFLVSFDLLIPCIVT